MDKVCRLPAPISTDLIFQPKQEALLSFFFFNEPASTPRPEIGSKKETSRRIGGFREIAPTHRSRPPLMPFTNNKYAIGEGCDPRVENGNLHRTKTARVHNTCLLYLYTFIMHPWSNREIPPRDAHVPISPQSPPFHSSAAPVALRSG